MSSYQYAMIGNCTTAALVSGECSIDWLCLPFFDSPSIFGRLLDAEKGGYFRIWAVGVVRTYQTYISHTAILKTVFETQLGNFEIMDYMPRFHSYSQETYCPPEIQRDIHVLSGRPQITVEFKPALNYASLSSQFVVERDGIKVVSERGQFDSFYLYTDLDPQKVLSGEPIEVSGSSYFLMSYYEKLQKINFDKIYLEYEKTKSYWLDWVYRTKLPQKHREMVIRSAITLKLLTFQRTGAVIAAPTTSLPEIIGKSRNWDYRFCWVRDASMIIDLYARIGHVKLAYRYIHFILNRMLLKHEHIAVVYGINGERQLQEEILEHLSGYENSKPVRIGNDAYRQQQNDLYGEFIETIYTYFFVHYRDRSLLDEEIWTNVCSLIAQVQTMWRRPDCGIWERRGELKHFVHSKMMNWVAMDRAAKIAALVGKKDNALQWGKEALIIKEDILANGWNPKMQAFCMCYGSDHLDAAVLLMLHYGFLDHQDMRIVNTVKQIYKNLVKNGFTFRYTEEDEFGHPENAFIVCTFWMINALYLIGEEAKAREMFDNVIKCANPFHLFSEDIEISTRRLTGNFPQGYSHLAFIQTVLLLETDYNWSDAAAIRTWLEDYDPKPAAPKPHLKEG